MRNHLAIDTPENRLFADRIYSMAFEDIRETLKSKGLRAATELAQNPKSNPRLMSTVLQASDGQWLLAAYILADTMTDAAVYLSTSRTGEVPVLRDARWASSTAAAQKILDMKADSVAEFDFLEHSRDVPDRFDFKTRKAAGMIIVAKKDSDEAARKKAEEARIKAQEQAQAAQEQARIAQAQAAEQARIAQHEQEERTAKQWADHINELAPLAQYLGVSSIPSCSLIGEANARGIPSKMIFTARADTIIPSLTNGSEGKKSHNAQTDHDSPRIPAGTKMTVYLGLVLDGYTTTPNPTVKHMVSDSGKPFIWSYWGDTTYIYNFPVESIALCSDSQ